MYMCVVVKVSTNMFTCLWTVSTNTILFYSQVIYKCNTLAEIHVHMYHS